jgi:arsenate reductase
LQADFADRLDSESVERLVNSSYGKLAAQATIRDFLPLLAERFTRQRLQALAKINGKSLDHSLIVLFLWNHITGRSQMAMAVVWSGGSAPTGEINPAAANPRRDRTPRAPTTGRPANPPAPLNAG